MGTTLVYLNHFDAEPVTSFGLEGLGVKTTKFIRGHWAIECTSEEEAADWVSRTSFLSLTPFDPPAEPPADTEEVAPVTPPPPADDDDEVIG